MMESPLYELLRLREQSRQSLKRIGREPNELQLAYRNGYYKQEETELAICDALVEQGGIAAWPGDGVGCVAQMIDVQVRRAERAEVALVAEREKHDEEAYNLIAEAKETAEAALAETREALRSIVSGFKSEATNGVICTPPALDIGNDDSIGNWSAEPNRTWCARCKARWQKLFDLDKQR